MQGEGEDSEVWDDDSDDEAGGGSVDNLGDSKKVQLSAEGRSSSDALVRWLVLFLMSWQAAFNISHQAMQQLCSWVGSFMYCQKLHLVQFCLPWLQHFPLHCS